MVQNLFPYNIQEKVGMQWDWKGSNPLIFFMRCGIRLKDYLPERSGSTGLGQIQNHFCKSQKTPEIRKTLQILETILERYKRCKRLACVAEASL